MPYDVPGNADQVSQAIKDAWNNAITKQFDQQFSPNGGYPDAAPFLKRSPEQVEGAGPSSNAVHWPGNPAEPRSCLDAAWAAKLSDWGVRGRHSFHNEYCEFGLVYGTDASGRARPKRFVATTELPEYWVTLAVHDPDFLRQTVNNVLGFTPAFTDLYGPQGAQPHALSPLQRRILFATYVSGNLRSPDLENANVPSNPIGDLNTKNILFMSHPINGLDDLIYIVAFGARPYTVKKDGAFRLATLHEIFRSQGATHLACRNADPGAAQGAYAQAMRSINPVTGKFRGAEIAFANPLGMYINAFTSGDFTFKDKPVPASWINKSRGKGELCQRLEFGPPDSDPHFLDDILVEEIAGQPEPLSSGYLVAKRIEVGPRVVIGKEKDFDVKLIEIDANAAGLDCSAANVCGFVRREKAAYEAAHGSVGPRGGM